MIRHILALCLLLLSAAAHAADTVPYACLPAQIAGTGTARP